MKGHTLKVESCSSHCTTPSDRADGQMVAVKVGCLHFNPASPRGRRQYMIQMLVLSFLPHAALILQNCTIMAQLSTTLDSALYLHSEVSLTLTLGETVAAIQDERMEMTTKLYYTQVVPHLDSKPLNKFQMEHIFAKTTTRLVEMPVPMISDQQKAFLLIADKVRKLLFAKISIYEDMNSEILVLIAKQVKGTTASLWRQLSAYYELLKSLEEFTLTVTVNAFLLTFTDFDIRTIAAFQRHQASALEHLQFTIQYLDAEGMLAGYSDLSAVEKVYREIRLVNSDEDDEGENATQKMSALFLDNGDRKLLTESKICIQKLKDVQTKLWAFVRESVKEEVWIARRTLVMGIVILVVVLLVSPTLILLLRHTVVTIQTFTQSIEISTQKLEAEKQKSDLLLSRMLPLPVLKRLRAQRTVPAEAYDAVTIFFSDIVGFTNISATSTPMQVINMLNMLYKLFDAKIMKYNVYKVETIGDAYMVVSGLPERIGNRHVSEIADMSLSLMRSLEGARVPHRPQDYLRIRAGVNTGSCVAGVVGTTMPRYCLFGDTINTASRMESTGEAMKIHISQTTKKALDEIGGYLVEPRGETDVAGKGVMETFWLVGKVGGEFEPESPQCMRLNDYDESFMELLIRS